MVSKATLESLVVEKTGCSKAAANRTITAIIDSIVSETAKGEDVQIFGLGSFKAVDRSERVCNNPLVGNITVPAHKAVKFKAAKAFKDAVQ